MARLGQLQMWQLGNINTTTDGFGFFGLLYGRQRGLLEPVALQAARVRPALRAGARDARRRRSARSSSRAGCRSSSPRTHRGSSTRTATRTCSCSRGCAATSTTRSTSIRGATVDIDLNAQAVAEDGNADERVAAQWLQRRAGRAALGCALRRGRADAPTWADPAKTLRVAFPVAETGFDPQATSDSTRTTSSARSSTRSTGSTISRGRYKRRAATPRRRCREIPTDGRTWTITRQAGHLLRRRSGVQGQEARARPRPTTSIRGSACSIRGCARRSSWYLQGKIVGADEVIATAKRERQVRLRRADRRAAGARPLHAADQAQRARLHPARLPDARRPMAAVAREVIEALRRRERLGDGQSRSAPARIMLKSWRRGQQIVLEANPNYRDERFPEAASRPTARSSRG